MKPGKATQTRDGIIAAETVPCLSDNFARSMERRCQEALVGRRANGDIAGSIGNQPLLCHRYRWAKP